MARNDPNKAQKIRQHIKQWDDNWKYNRDQYHLFTTFVMGEQWTEDESRVFENYRKIPLTRNKLAPLIAHLVGEQRQNTPNLQCFPEDGVDEQTAEVREALVKDISLSSHAKVVYQTGFQQAAVGGHGAALVMTKYKDERSFHLEPDIRAVKDPTRCYWDLSAESPCKTDGMFAGNRTRMSRKKFRALYGKKLEQKIPTSNEENTFIPVADDDSITIIDHFEREYKSEKIYQLSDGSTVNQKELDELDTIEMEESDMVVLMKDGGPVTIIDSRDAHKYTVKHSKWAGDYELESADFPSEQLPVVFIDQNSYWDKKGRQICRPFIKDAKDAQKYLNYLFTQSAYLLKISRYDQFLVSKANVKSPDTQTIWRDPSTVQGGLVYDESPNGNKPEQLRPPELSQSFNIQYEIAVSDIEASTGMYKSQLGEQGNEISGKAIDARTRRGSYNTFVPFDSLNRSIAVIGEIINEMIPKLYDKERTVQLNMKDKGMTDITLNKPIDPYGGGIENDMTSGRFKIRLMPGPSYEGQKQESLESFNMVLQADRGGQVFPMIADLYVENLPLANNIELKNRLRVIVPPEIIEAGKTGEPPPPKEPPPDPMLELKKQELQFKFIQMQSNAQHQMNVLQLEEQKMLMNSHNEGTSFAKSLEEIQQKRTEIIAKLKEQEMRFEAEMKRMQVDLHMHHTNNIAKILTHQPNHFKAEKEKSNGNAQRR